MQTKRVIVAAIGEKGVRYGNGRHLPTVFLVLVEVCKADSYDVCAAGCVVSYNASPRSLKSLETFFSYAEAVREIMPDLGIGISEGKLPHRFQWFGLRPDRSIDLQAADRALAGIQGPQNYRDEFERLRIA